TTRASCNISPFSLSFRTRGHTQPSLRRLRRLACACPRPGMTNQNLRGLVQSLLRGHAAVQSENRASGKTAFVAGEKQDAGGDLLGCAEPPEQLPRRQCLARGLGIGALR